EVLVNGANKIQSLRPTVRVHADADAACAYVAFDADGGPVVVTIKAAGGGDGEVIVNGFEVDTPDPNRKAIKPSPADPDGHADADSGSLSLSWSSHAPAAAHDLYLGTDPAAVGAAGRSDAAFKGSLSGPSYRAEGLSSRQDYFWRVDEVDGNGEVTRGDVWRFRPRHLAFPRAARYRPLAPP